MKILGIDPGKTTGVALIELAKDNDGRKIILPKQVLNTKDMTLVSIKYLIDQVDAVVYEGWRTFDKVAKAGRLSFQTVPAEQVIGSLKTLLKLRETQPMIYENLSSAKPVGYAYSNMKYVPGKKGMHWQDALAHAVWVAVEKEKWPPVKP